MNTKEKIAYEALTLFSTRGFSAVSVRDIARAVGIKESSIYNHYKGKQAIFDTIVATYDTQADSFFSGFASPKHLEGNVIENMAYIKDIDVLVQITLTAIEEYLNNDYFFKFFRMLSIERVNNPKAREVFQAMFIDGAIAFQEQLFGWMMENGYFIKASPKVAALQFYSPIFLMFNQYEPGVTDIDAIKSTLEEHIRQFDALYAIEEKKE